MKNLMSNSFKSLKKIIEFLEINHNLKTKVCKGEKIYKEFVF